MGQKSEVVLEDVSTNGTRVGNLFLKGGTTILHSGAKIGLASIPNGSKSSSLLRVKAVQSFCV